ncbi:Peroxin-3 [Vararia minispora EC-137]|uniref:Peroxin-3 n=1 Tax=Vararia minispora EC-137 TaxID=1314806 RepID=A0ACB8QEY4_9AGAM|nr:Peroxin-3 [Vararia minispora EC-137]
MLHSIGTYFYERRRGYAKALGIVGGLYMVGRYVGDRLEDVRRKVVEERSAREGDSLRKRFKQNLDDISFTIMAHLPILMHNVLTDMNVEALTAELQSLSKAARDRPAPELQPPMQGHNSPRTPSLASSVELVHEGAHDARSDSGSASILSYSVQDDASSRLAESQLSWVQPSVESSPARRAAVPSSSSSEAGGESMSSSGVSSADGVPSSDPSGSRASLTTSKKAEMWREVKLLTVTRTLTVVYSVSLLSIFTHIQLSLLGRYKYLHSIVQLERDEGAREQNDGSIASFFFAPRENPFDAEAQFSKAGIWQEDSLWQDGIDAQTERKYLTLSWWILNVGWKDVGERVRRGVDEVFEDVSLKSKLGPVELHRLISDVRRRVEHEVTFEGDERRINFTSTLLPPTASAVTHLLARNGFSPSQGDGQDPAFTQLLEETRDVLASADFHLVLERCLDKATETLFDGLRRNVFVPDAEGEETPVRLAGMLPGLARWSSLALNSVPNELVDGLACLYEISAFAAIMYSDYESRLR